MLNSQLNIDELIIKFRNATLSDKEQIILQEWIDASGENRKVFENLTNKKWVTTELSKIYEFDEKAGWDTIANVITSKEIANKSSKFWYKWVAAAILIMASSTGYWAFILNTKNKDSDRSLTQKQRFGTDIKAPESNKAILTLADGKKILLEEAAIGKIANKEGVEIEKKGNGQIVYKVINEKEDNSKGNNKICIPKGSKPLLLQLADGTEVWLNTGSSLCYPSKFFGSDRKVTMTGEIFFKVAKNPAMPFKVMSNGIETRALGTQFNINAYSDEPIAKITLVEGSIKVEQKKKNSPVENLIVKPGQQVSGGKSLQLVQKANIDEVMAWKNGEFQFEGANIKTIMSQISKYYNVEVAYEDDIDYSFVLKMPRTVPVSELLKIMELTDLVHFKIEKNKIIVLKNKKSK